MCLCRFRVFEITTQVDADAVPIIPLCMCAHRPFRSTKFNRAIFSDNVMIPYAGPSVSKVHIVDAFSGKVIIRQIACVVDDNQVSIIPCIKGSEFKSIIGKCWCLRFAHLTNQNRWCRNSVRPTWLNTLLWILLRFGYQHRNEFPLMRYNCKRCCPHPLCFRILPFWRLYAILGNRILSLLRCN